MQEMMRMTFDIFYSTLLYSRNYLTTVETRDKAQDMCLEHNKKLSKEEITLGLGNMHFEENEEMIKMTDEEILSEYVDFGDISRGRLGLQCQYSSRYITGNIEGYPNLGEGLRFIGNDRNYHSYKIHKDDVEEFVRRHKKYLECSRLYK